MYDVRTDPDLRGFYSDPETKKDTEMGQMGTIQWKEERKRIVQRRYTVPLYRNSVSQSRSWSLSTHSVESGLSSSKTESPDTSWFMDDAKYWERGRGKGLRVETCLKSLVVESLGSSFSKEESVKSIQRLVKVVVTN